MTIFIEMNSEARHTTEYADTLTREQRTRAREIMAGQFAELIARSPAENLYWQESTTDLMDVAHEVYMTEMLVDGQGRPCGFGPIVRRACAVLHVPTPANPSSMAFNARNRKGVRQMSMFSRFCWLMYFKGIRQPFNGMVKRVGEG